MQVGGIFDHGLVVRGYEAMTSQPLWRREIDALLSLDDGRDVERPRRCLDLGCGPGESTFVLAARLPRGSEVVGIDCSAPMIARARDLAERRTPTTALHFEQADAADLPFAADTFDLAIGHSFLYLVADPRRVLEEVRRVLVPGSPLHLMEPNRDGWLLRAAWRSRATWPAALRTPITSARFVASMVMWRLVSGRTGQLTSEALHHALANAGLATETIEPALGGLGLRCVARA